MWGEDAVRLGIAGKSEKNVERPFVVLVGQLLATVVPKAAWMPLTTIVAVRDNVFLIP